MMNHRWPFALGVILTILASTLGLVLVPNWQFRDLKPFKDDMGYDHPVEPFGAAKHGRQVYIDLGCIYCHSQQVRSANYGADIDRGWGTRRSVARDYIYDNPHLLGTMRTGPDLANIGARQPSRDWHSLHLYNPQITSPGSVMPPHAFLFQKKELKDDALPKNGILLPKQWSETPAYIVPNERAEWLIEYLKSLDHTYELPEAK
jgi:cytochrome c oxidase cbb3-type subunit 2